LLVMLMEAKYNESLTSYVQKTLNDLADRFGERVVRACQLVAALHTFDLGFPARLLETISEPRAGLASLGGDGAKHSKSSRGSGLVPEIYPS